MKKITFHEAQVNVVLKIADEERTFEKKNFLVDICLLTDKEWLGTRDNIVSTVEQLQTDLDKTENNIIE